MTQELARKRTTVAAALVFGAVVLTGGTAFLVAPRDPAAASMRNGPVLPGFSQASRQAREITITTRDEAYRLVRGERNWILPERGGYVVRPDRLNALAEGLAGLAYDRSMTADPKKLDRLSLGDPTRGGDGVSVRVTGVDGAVLADLILGVQPSGLFVRQPNEVQSYAVAGALPPLREAGAWLDLAVTEIAPDKIERADFEPVGAPAFSLRRAAPGAPDFVPLGVYSWRRPTEAGGFAKAATALSRIGLIDVRPASDGLTFAGRQRTVSADGLIVQTTLFTEGSKFWVRFEAVAGAPAAMPDADRINARARDWLFGITPSDAALLAPVFDSLSPRPVVVARASPAASMAPPAPNASMAPPPSDPVPDEPPL